MTLDLLVSVYRQGIYSLAMNIPKAHHNMRIIVVHQLEKNDEYDIDSLLKLSLRSDITYVKSHTKGVTISRNIAMTYSEADIILFCDDDVQYADSLYEMVVGAHQQYSEELITFAYKNSGERDFSSKIKRLNYRSILSVGTIEISCKRKFIQHNHITFPEDMGAGRKLFLCDEPVFLAKILKAHGRGIYIPKYIGEHENLSSGIIFNDLDAFKSRLLCFKRVFGPILGQCLYYLFLIKNYKRFSNRTSVWNAMVRVHSYE